MTKHDLKELAAMGAELGAAKAENERLREVLRCIADLPMDRCSTENDYRLSAAKAIALGALSQQAEPTDTFTAVDMATAAAQGFRDGQAAMEQAAAQDERKTFEVEIPDISAIYDGRSFIPYRSLEAGERLMTVAQHLRIEKQLRAALTRPAQTEQQPVQYTIGDLTYARVFRAAGLTNLSDMQAVLDAVEAAIAQTAPQPEQSELVEAACAVIRATDWWSANEDSPKSALAHFARATDALRAALSAQGESHE